MGPSPDLFNLLMQQLEIQIFYFKSMAAILQLNYKILKRCIIFILTIIAKGWALFSANSPTLMPASILFLASFITRLYITIFIAFFGTFLMNATISTGLLTFSALGMIGLVTLVSITLNTTFYYSDFVLFLIFAFMIIC